MRVTASLILSFVAVCLLCPVLGPAEAAWRPVRERQDFKVDDRAAVLESAFEELREIYGSDLDIEELKKGKAYVHSIRSEEFGKDIILVMIEDRAQQDEDIYYRVIFALPDMNVVQSGGIWLGTPLEDYLRAVPAEIYGEDGLLSEEP